MHSQGGLLVQGLHGYLAYTKTASPSDYRRVLGVGRSHVLPCGKFSFYERGASVLGILVNKGSFRFGVVPADKS